jgi:2-oxoglutarate ferredoxin oxidoreductase subunit beta
MADFSGYTPTWCPGCGDWGIGAAIKNAFTQMGYSPSSLAVVFGIGCSGNMNDFLNAYAIHSLHGRALSNAIGIKIANHTMPVFVIAGDGDTFGEGGNHFLHACRGNHDITAIVHDNGVYGLTTGQSAPTAQKGYKSRSTPDGIIEIPVNPLTLAISQGATFVAQAFAGNIPHLIEMIKAGSQHKGFSLVNILQPCVTFNKVNTYAYYRERTYELDASYNKADFHAALQKASEPTFNERFPLGIIYQEVRPTYTESLPQLAEKTLLQKERFNQIETLLEEYV